MRHLLSAALYTLTVVLMLVMIAAYVLGSYASCEFIRDFWWVWLLMIGSVVLGAYFGEPERFPRIFQPKQKHRRL
jgi:hypothetical protein